MNDTPDPNEPGRPRRRFWRPSSASEWVELAIYVFFALIALLAGVGWLVARRRDQRRSTARRAGSCPGGV